MSKQPSILIQFDALSWTPTVFINGRTDEETEKLKAIVNVMQKNIETDEKHHDGEKHETKA